MEEIRIPVIYEYDPKGLLDAIEDSQAASVSTGEYRAEIEKLDAAMRKAANDILSKSLNETTIQMAAMKQTQAEFNKLTEIEARLLRSKAGSYNAVSAEIELIALRLKQMTKEERATSKEAQELTARLDHLTDELDSLSVQTSKTAKETGGMVDEFAEMPGVTGKAGRSVSDLSKNFKLLLRNPVVAFITAIVAVLGALAAGFTRSEQGANLLSKATGVVNGVMSTLTEVSTKSVNAIKSLFGGGIEEGFKNIGQSILDNIINRFKAVPKLIGNIGAGLKALVTGDFETAKKAALEVNEALVQGITGLDGDQQEAIIEGIKDTAARANELSRAYINLADKKKALQLQNIALTRSLGELSKAESVAAANASDTTLSFKQQQQALTELEEIQRNRLNTERTIARNNLSIINEEIRIRRSANEEVTSLLEQQAQAISEVQRVESELTLSVVENARTRREIRRDEFERELDFAVDFYDAQKTQLERQISDENNSIIVREQNLERLKELDKSAFSEQITLLENFTGQKLNLQELSLEQDERVVRERLRQFELDDVTLGRVLEVLRERKAATQDIADAEKEITKAKADAEKEAEKQRDEDKAKAREEAVKEFEALQQLKEAEFNLTRQSAQARTRFELEQEKEKLDKILELNQQFQDGLTDTQIAAIEKTKEGIDQNLSQLDNIFDRVKEKIFNKLGFDDEKAKQVFGAFESAFDEITKSRQAVLEAEIEAQDKLLDAIGDRISEQEKAVEIELELKKEGFANNLEAERENLAQLNEEKRLAEEKQIELQEKAAKRQAAIDTAQQISSLITATANIFEGFSSIPIVGQVLAVAAVASMFASFAASKVNAKKAAQQLRKGKKFTGKIKGKPHEEGGEPLLHGDVLYEAEDNEILIGTKPSVEHEDFLLDVNKGKYEGDNLPDLIERGREAQGLEEKQTPDSNIQPKETKGENRTDNSEVGGESTKEFFSLQEKEGVENNSHTHEYGYKELNNESVHEKTADPNETSESIFQGHSAKEYGHQEFIQELITERLHHATSENIEENKERIEFLQQLLEKERAAETERLEKLVSMKEAESSSSSGLSGNTVVSEKSDRPEKSESKEKNTHHAELTDREKSSEKTERSDSFRDAVTERFESTSNTETTDSLVERENENSHSNIKDGKFESEHIKDSSEKEHLSETVEYLGQAAPNDQTGTGIGQSEKSESTHTEISSKEKSTSDTERLKNLYDTERLYSSEKQNELGQFYRSEIYGREKEQGHLQSVEKAIQERFFNAVSSGESGSSIEKKDHQYQRVDLIKELIKESNRAVFDKDIIGIPEMPDILSDRMPKLHKSEKKLIKAQAANRDMGTHFDKLEKEIRDLKQAVKDKKVIAALPTGEIYEEGSNGNSRYVNIKKVGRK